VLSSPSQQRFRLRVEHLSTGNASASLRSRTNSCDNNSTPTGFRPRPSAQKTHGPGSRRTGRAKNTRCRWIRDPLTPSHSRKEARSRVFPTNQLTKNFPTDSPTLHKHTSTSGCDLPCHCPLITFQVGGYKAQPRDILQPLIIRARYVTWRSGMGVGDWFSAFNSNLQIKDGGTISTR